MEHDSVNLGKEKLDFTWAPFHPLMINKKVTN